MCGVQCVLSVSGYSSALPLCRNRTEYKTSFPKLSELSCKCEGNHTATCGCLTRAFISKAHTNFTSILMEAQSQEEFVRRIQALPKHARDIHEWEGGRCATFTLFAFVRVGNFCYDLMLWGEEMKESTDSSPAKTHL